jgi:hypothetical protein
MEVLVAVAIFLFSMVVISQMFQSASLRALRTKRLTRAALFCESKIEEIVFGLQPLQSSGLQPLEGAEPGWLYSMAVEPESWSSVPYNNQTVTGLCTLHVTVVWSGGRSMDRVEFTLSRLMLDPNLRVPMPTPTPATSAPAGASPTGT